MAAFLLLRVAQHDCLLSRPTPTVPSWTARHNGSFVKHWVGVQRGGHHPRARSGHKLQFNTLETAPCPAAYPHRSCPHVSLIGGPLESSYRNPREKSLCATPCAGMLVHTARDSMLAITSPHILLRSRQPFQQACMPAVVIWTSGA
eukprot:291794-Chlamydomonas_euryale.AAC.10